MKPKRLLLLGLILLGLTACTAQPAITETSVPEAASPTEGPSTETEALPGEPSKTIFKTDIGELVYRSARFVSEVHGVTPAPEHKILLVGLGYTDQTAVDVQAFQDAHMEIAIQGDDGSYTANTMAGLFSEEFAIGFMLPDTAKTYTLVWGDNPLIDPTADVE